jgi:CheY-like chemotaxis protein
MQSVESTRVLFKKEVDLSVDIGLPGVNFVLGDSFRLNQILNNFLSNASKFTSEGEVELKVRLGQKKENNFEVKFTVRDTGIGMSNSTVSKLFKPFEQADSSLARQFGGTGLGLVIAQRLIRMMNGEVHVWSALGEGTVFSWTIWLVHSEEPSERNSAYFDLETNKVPQNVRSILLVEDNKYNQIIISKLLQMNTYKVSVADNGKEAVKCAKSEKYDAILMDFQMPEMDGITATKHIRNLGISTPVIGLTANADEFSRADAIESGMCRLVMKPVNAVDLRLAIEKSLEEVTAS